MFRAIVVDEGVPAEIREVDDDFLQPGDVTIDVEYSSLNYKDGLALSGNRGVVRTWPLIPGIDVVGVVAQSSSGRFAPGDRVLLNGDGMGERAFGGFAERARVRADALIHLPEGLSPQRAAAIGTAGFTAMIGVLAIERAGIRPADGDVLVTGAAGGVGSVAVALLAGRGYAVTASTGRADEHGDYLRSIGAGAVIDRAEFADLGKPLQKARWAAAIDSVGSSTLANVLAQTNYGGIVVSCGLAQGADLPVTVMPFILRAVTLSGANSVEAPLDAREHAWATLAAELDGELLSSMTTTIGLSDVIGAGAQILAGRVRGRTVIDVRQ
ncbi:MAG: oxidoreductase [Subtercola sp.]|nr:oxidoreductase [Subtercola sp.]